MNRPRIAAVTIGQTPRPDLIEALVARIGIDDVFEVGALDGLATDAIPGARGGAGSYPLSTRLRDGRRVTVDEADLAPLVQQAIDRAEQAGAAVTLLLCAGGFLGTRGRGTLVRPFDAAIGGLRAIGARRIAVVVPFAAQVSSSRSKWQDAGFDVDVVVAEPATVDASQNADFAGRRDAIVLDYVGHAARDIDALRARSNVPVLDLGECGADAAVAALSGAVGSAPMRIR
jgi:AroM protein